MLLQVLADGSEIEVEFARMLGSIFVDFFVYGVFHDSISRVSSGEQLSGLR